MKYNEPIAESGINVRIVFAALRPPLRGSPILFTAIGSPIVIPAKAGIQEKSYENVGFRRLNPTYYFPIIAGEGYFNIYENRGRGVYVLM